MSKFLKLISGLALIHQIGACSLAGKVVTPPKVDLQKVEFADTSLSETTLIFNFVVENPNAFGLTVERIDYSVNLNSKPFTNGVLESGFTIDGKASRVVPLPVRVKFSDIFSSVAEMLRTGSTPYEVKGAINLGYLTIPFSDTGEVKLSTLKK